MKAVLQRVTQASVSVDAELVSSIKHGVMCLIGIGSNDTLTDAESLAKSILNKRVFPDAQGEKEWSRSVMESEGEVLCVSQFTLMANTKKGNKPDFHGAMAAEQSRELYSQFLEKLRNMYQAERIKDGRFQAMMQVSLTNDGPVTLVLDTHETRDGKTATPEVSQKAQEVAAEKQRKREENEARAKANADKKRQRQEEGQQ